MRTALNMSRKILIIGSGSYLAHNWISSCNAAQFLSARHRQIGDVGLLDGIDTAVNFLAHSDVDRRILSDGELPEARIATWLKKTSIHLIQLSSRRVYATSEIGLNESSDVKPISIGGINKMLGEECLRKHIAPERLSILRLGNIFGLERDPRRSTFFTTALESLKTRGVITLNVAPTTRKDFLPVEAFCRHLSAFVDVPVQGVFNIGSGIATKVSDVCRWVILGYGQGRVVCKGHSPIDEFVMDCSKFEAQYKLTCDLSCIKAAAVAVGKALADET